MGRVFGLTAVVIVSLLLAGLVLFFAFSPSGVRAFADRTRVRPVPDGDQEIVWLEAATDVVAWDRFVASIHRLSMDRPELGLEIEPAGNPFPTDTTAIPELAVRAGQNSGRLWFRWYKLTGELGPSQWVASFAERAPAPLAIIGGGSTDRASDLAHELSIQSERFQSAPLFLITSATAVHVGSEPQQLMDIYPGRTFRFCFTNRQMAEATADFIWTQDDLRPDGEPFYMVQWNDDPYSTDLYDQFHDILGPDGFSRLFHRRESLADLARHWGWLAGRLALGGVPVGWDLKGIEASAPGLAAPSPFWSTDIPYSVGGYWQANPAEVEAADKIVAGLDQQPAQRRPLLVLPAWPEPGRRFLRALLRTAPVEARRFTVVTGDAIDLDVIYRDRELAWPIQDLPVPLVIFCHRNPVDPAVFGRQEDTSATDPLARTATSSQDLLLDRDIVEAVIRAAYQHGRLCEDADALRAGLVGDQHAENRPFTRKGNLRSRRDEYVACLRPIVERERVLPRARLQVWKRETNTSGRRAWVPVPVAGASELIVNYASSPGS